MSIVVKKDDLTQIVCDAIVNPANSYGYMGGGVAGAIKRAGGLEIEKEAVAKSPIQIGEAIVTTPGKLPCKYVIHAPTMNRPAVITSVENVRLATNAAFELGIQLKIKSIAIPGMGTGVGGVPVDDAAKVIVKVAKNFENRYEKIFLIDRNDEMVNAFIRYV